MFQKAEKEAVTLKLLLAGIAGVGKSYTGLYLSQLLAGPHERFAVIDAENRKARMYADHFNFDVSDLETFSLAAYTKEIKAAEAAGYRVCFVDGLSQLWEERGGIKELVEVIAKRDRIPVLSAWLPTNHLLYDFITMIMRSEMHIICTVKARTGMESFENAQGKTQYRRANLEPIQKDSLQFLFDFYAMLDTEHDMIFHKSMCTKLDRKVVQASKDGELEKLVTLLQKWMEGVPRPDRSETSLQPVNSTQAFNAACKLGQDNGAWVKSTMMKSIADLLQVPRVTPELAATLTAAQLALITIAATKVQAAETEDLPSIDEVSADLLQEAATTA